VRKPCTGGLEFLPEAVPDEFGVCAMLRIPTGLPERVPGILRNLAEDRWYDIAVAAGPCEELRRRRGSVLLTPIFRRGGSTHRWVSELKAAMEELTA
jgi:hypothetical protein